MEKLNDFKTIDLVSKRKMEIKVFLKCGILTDAINETYGTFY